MSDRSRAECIDLIREVQFGFEGTDGMWVRNDEMEAFLEAIYDMRLPDDLNHREPIYSHDIDDDIAMTMGLMDGAASVHIDPLTGYKRDEIRADDREAWDAWNLVQLGLTPGDWRYDAWLRGQACKVAVASWLNVRDYATPTRDLTKEPRTSAGNEAYNKRVDKYETDYYPLELEIDPLRTSAWNERGHKVTVASRVFWLPYIDVCRRFGGMKRDEEMNKEEENRQALKVLGENFGYLRGAENVPESGVQLDHFLNRRAHVRLLDDGVTWLYAVDGLEAEHLSGKTRDQADNQLEILRQVPNTLARPSLFPLCGRYYGDEPFHKRYQPILRALMTLYMNRDYFISLRNGLIQDLIMDAFEATDAASAVLAEMTTAEREARSVSRSNTADRIQPIPGRLASTSGSADKIKFIGEEIEGINDRIVGARPASQYTGGLDAQKMIQEGTLGAIQRMDEVTQLPLRQPAAIRNRIINEILDAKDEYHIRARNPHYERGSGKAGSADTNAKFVLSGREAMKDREAEPGKQVEISPSVLDIKAERSVTTRNTSLSAQMARYAFEVQKYDRADGTHATTWAEVVGAASGRENVTAYLDDLDEDAFVLELVPDAFRVSHQNWLELQEALWGTAPGALSEPLDVDVAANEQQQTGTGPADQAMGQRPRVAPYIEQPQGEAVAPI